MLIITLEGFATASLSCYGSSWNRTSAIDELAAYGLTWDRAITSTTDPVEQFRRWMRSPVLPAGEIVLVTDDDRLITDDATDVLRNVHCIDEPVDDVADDWESTALARLAAVAIDKHRDAPIVWLHSRFLTQAWDAPRDLFLIDEIEIDDVESEGEDDPEQPELPLVFDDLTPPHVNVLSTDDPDLVLAWMRTYASQIQLIDVVLRAIRSGIESSDNPAVVLGGVSGFALGQNGFIGHQGDVTRSSQIRVPLIVSGGDCLRVSGVTCVDVLPDLIARRHHGASSPVMSPTRWIVPAQREGVVVTVGRSGQAVAITTPSWLLVQSDLCESGSEPSLFVKPDDQDDVNDVASLRRNVVDDLRSILPT